VTAVCMLSPDGLQFCDPVTLTVSLPSRSVRTRRYLWPKRRQQSILRAEHQRSLELFARSLISVPALSPIGRRRWQKIYNSLWSQAEADYQYAAKFIDTLASSKETPPPPPDYTYQCDPEAKAIEDDQVNFYAKNLFAWEMP